MALVNSEEKKHLLLMSPDEKWVFAGRLLKAVTSMRNYVMAFSGGKDSVLMEVLAIENGVKVPKVYNVTTIDPEGTITFCKKHGCEISRPERSFLDIVEAKGHPTMFKRFCCDELKEKYIADYLLCGIRKYESVKRQNRYTCFEDTVQHTKDIVTQRFFPLLYFTSDDVAYIVEKLQIEMHPIYYDGEHKFRCERRLGCIGCPLQSDRGKLDFLRYPKLLKQIALRMIIYHENHGRTKEDAYKNLVYDIFYSNHGYDKYQQTYEGLFDTDAHEFLETYFHITRP